MIEIGSWIGFIACYDENYTKRCKADNLGVIPSVFRKLGN
jgi:hypothetical protein